MTGWLKDKSIDFIYIFNRIPLVFLFPLAQDLLFLEGKGEFHDHS